MCPFFAACFVTQLRYERQGTMGYNMHKDPEHIAVADIEDVDEALVMALSAFDSEVSHV